jgi:hypothetical protein
LRSAPWTGGHRLDVGPSLAALATRSVETRNSRSTAASCFPTRSSQLAGTARVDPNAPDTVLDAVMGTTAPGAAFTSADHLFGDLDARASRAFDGDPTTAWTPNFGPQGGRWVEAQLPGPVTVDHVDLTVIADARHSVPTQFTLQADDGSMFLHDP